MIAGLYIVSTPIGNLDDITIRALNTLKNSNIILCEDSRVSQKLLTQHNITGHRLQVYNEHSTLQDRESIARSIENGSIVSLISDAGTPLISDPGYKLVRFLYIKNYHVDVIPGCCSVIAALTISGLPSDQFVFAGFVPKTDIARQQFFAEFINLDATIVCFESAKRISKTLAVAFEIFGDREASVVRELTKLYQERRTDLLSTLCEYHHTHNIKGEVVLLISSQKAVIDPNTINLNLESFIESLLKKGLTAKDSADLAYMNYKLSHSKSSVYQITNKLKQKI